MAIGLLRCSLSFNANFSINRAIWILLSARACADRSGDGVFEGFMMDITGNRQIEEENDRLSRRLERNMAHVKKRFAACAHLCKLNKIRDDMGYWNQIEKHIIDHSDAKPSHGICPECIESCVRDGINSAYRAGDTIKTTGDPSYDLDSH